MCGGSGKLSSFFEKLKGFGKPKPEAPKPDAPKPDLGKPSEQVDPVNEGKPAISDQTSTGVVSLGNERKRKNLSGLNL